MLRDDGMEATAARNDGGVSEDALGAAAEAGDSPVKGKSCWAGLFVCGGSKSGTGNGSSKGGGECVDDKAPYEKSVRDEGVKTMSDDRKVNNALTDNRCFDSNSNRIDSNSTADGDNAVVVGNKEEVKIQSDRVRDNLEADNVRGGAECVKSDGAFVEDTSHAKECPEKPPDDPGTDISSNKNIESNSNGQPVTEVNTEPALCSVGQTNITDIHPEDDRIAECSNTESKSLIPSDAQNQNNAVSESGMKGLDTGGDTTENISERAEKPGEYLNAAKSEENRDKVGVVESPVVQETNNEKSKQNEGKMNEVKTEVKPETIKKALNEEKKNIGEVDGHQGGEISTIDDSPDEDKIGVNKKDSKEELQNANDDMHSQLDTQKTTKENETIEVGDKTGNNSTIVTDAQLDTQKTTKENETDVSDETGSNSTIVMDPQLDTQKTTKENETKEVGDKTGSNSTIVTESQLDKQEKTKENETTEVGDKKGSNSTIVMDPQLDTQKTTKENDTIEVGDKSGSNSTIVTDLQLDTQKKTKESKTIEVGDKTGSNSTIVTDAQVDAQKKTKENEATEVGEKTGSNPTIATEPQLDTQKTANENEKTEVGDKTRSNLTILTDPQLDAQMSTMENETGEGDKTGSNSTIVTDAQLDTQKTMKENEKIEVEDKTGSNSTIVTDPQLDTQKTTNENEATEVGDKTGSNSTIVTDPQLDTQKTTKENEATEVRDKTGSNSTIVTDPQLDTQKTTKENETEVGDKTGSNSTIVTDPQLDTQKTTKESETIEVGDKTGSNSTIVTDAQVDIQKKTKENEVMEVGDKTGSNPTIITEPQLDTQKTVNENEKTEVGDKTGSNLTIVTDLQVDTQKTTNEIETEVGDKAESNSTIDTGTDSSILHPGNKDKTELLLDSETKPTEVSDVCKPSNETDELKVTEKSQDQVTDGNSSSTLTNTSAEQCSSKLTAILAETKNELESSKIPNESNDCNAIGSSTPDEFATPKSIEIPPDSKIELHPPSNASSEYSEKASDISTVVNSEQAATTQAAVLDDSSPTKDSTTSLGHDGSSTNLSVNKSLQLDASIDTPIDEPVPCTEPVERNEVNVTKNISAIALTEPTAEIEQKKLASKELESVNMSLTKEGEPVLATKTGNEVNNELLDDKAATSSDRQVVDDDSSKTEKSPVDITVQEEPDVDTSSSSASVGGGERFNADDNEKLTPAPSKDSLSSEEKPPWMRGEATEKPPSSSSSESGDIEEDDKMGLPINLDGEKRPSINTLHANRGFDSEEVAEYKDVFKYFDKEKTGLITSKNMATTLRALKPQPDEYLVEEKIEEIDRDFSGKVNFQQYLDVLHNIIRKAKKKQRKRSCYTNLSEKQMGEIKDAFTMFDHDGDGTISASELKSVMMNIGVYSTDEDIQDMVREVDEDESGQLEFPEFVQLMTRKISGAEVSNEMLEAFRYFDKDGDGTISASEIRSVMDALGEDLSETEIEEMIAEADRKGLGGVTYEDFVKMISSQ